MATIYTIGHSMRSAEQFLALLVGHGIELVVDVRQFPGSRRYPQFNLEPLAMQLKDAGIEYIHEVSLGGRRPSRAGSPNIYWRNLSFRGYADHMETAEFSAALDRLIALGSQRTTAIMCSEALPWRCHRRLIADALVIRGHDVLHIIGHQDAESHILNPHLRVTEAGVLVYDQAIEGDELPLFPEDAQAAGEGEQERIGSA
jgi:uncharacterized protein (DUF488 family)